MVERWFMWLVPYLDFAGRGVASIMMLHDTAPSCANEQGSTLSDICTPTLRRDPSQSDKSRKPLCDEKLSERITELQEYGSQYG